MIQTNPLSEQVYQNLLERILSGVLPPGAALREIELARELAVSRTPVREALARLVEDGLAENKPNRRTVVRRLGHAEIIELYQVREALEGMAAELACGKLTAADLAQLDSLAARIDQVDEAGYLEAHYRLDVCLHRLIASRSSNALLARQIHKFHNLMYLLRGRFAKQARELKQADRQHRDIIAALKTGDPAVCRRAVTQHLRSFASFSPGWFVDEPVAVASV